MEREQILIVGIFQVPKILKKKLRLGKAWILKVVWTAIKPFQGGIWLAAAGRNDYSLCQTIYSKAPWGRHDNPFCEPKISRTERPGMIHRNCLSKNSTVYHAAPTGLANHVTRDVL